MSELPATARCLVCGDGLEGKLAICPNCGTPHHDDCMEYNRGCAVYGCAQIQPLDSENGDEQSTLSQTDLTNMSMCVPQSKQQFYLGTKLVARKSWYQLAKLSFKELHALTETCLGIVHDFTGERPRENCCERFDNHLRLCFGTYFHTGNDPGWRGNIGNYDGYRSLVNFASGKGPSSYKEWSSFMGFEKSSHHQITFE